MSFSYGRPDEQQRDVIRKHVFRREVVDLGCGTMQLSQLLAQLGASQVVAIDKERLVGDYAPDTSRITFVRTYFDDIERSKADAMMKNRVAFVSWPTNVKEPALVHMVKKASVFIYIGKNTDGVSCGSPGLFDFEREVLDYVPRKLNTLIVYGPKRVPERAPLGEELASHACLDNFFRYEDVEQDRRSDGMPQVEPGITPLKETIS